MARYVLLRVDSTEKADTLIERLADTVSVKVVGVFAAGNRFCECGISGNTIRSKRWGTVHCRACKRVRQSVMQHPRNLLYDRELHPYHHNAHISVWEPALTPEQEHGDDYERVLSISKAKRAEGKRRIDRHKVSERRKARRREAS